MASLRAVAAAARRARVALTLVVAGEGALALVDALTARHVVLAGLFVVGPLVLATVGRPRPVAAVGLLAIVLAVASGWWDHYFLSLDHLIHCAVVVIGSALAVMAARARVEAERAREEVESTAERLAAERAQVEGILGVVAEAVTVNEADGHFVFANAAALELMGVATLKELQDTPANELFARFESSHEDGTPVSPDELPGRRLLRGEEATPLLIRRLDRARGDHRWLVLKAARLDWRGDRDVAVNVLEDVTETKDLELRERFLADASELLASSSLDFAQTLQRIAQLGVPRLADWCAVEIAQEPGRARHVASAHIDPVQGAVVEELRERYPPIDEASIGIPAVLRTGNPELYPLITDEMLADAARDEEQLRLVRALGARSAMIVPMRVGDRTVGAMMFVSGDGLRQYGERDLNLALELATRAGTALDNAQVHRERSEAADTLQRSLLPAALPELPGWSSATLYRPADQGNRIGGDFYDIVVLEDGFFVLVGDVTGKGVKAAALTALARHSTRTAALLGVPPAGTLAMLNRILLDQPGRSIITMLCAKVTQRPGGTTVTVASGGHPLPLRSRDGEPPIELGAHGLTLGWSREGEWSDSAAELAAGDGLLFYTDGVTDTAGSVDRFGDARLRELLMSLERGPDAVIAGLDAALHAYQSRPLADDVAVVSLQLHSHVSPAHSGLPINSPRARLPA